MGGADIPDFVISPRLHKRNFPLEDRAIDLWTTAVKTEKRKNILLFGPFLCVLWEEEMTLMKPLVVVFWVWGVLVVNGEWFVLVEVLMTSNEYMIVSPYPAEEEIIKEIKTK